MPFHARTYTTHKVYVCSIIEFSTCPPVHFLLTTICAVQCRLLHQNPPREHTPVVQLIPLRSRCPHDMPLAMGQFPLLWISVSCSRWADAQITHQQFHLGSGLWAQGSASGIRLAGKVPATDVVSGGCSGMPSMEKLCAYASVGA